MANLGLHSNQLAIVQKRFDDCEKLSRSFRFPAASWYDMAHEITRCAYHERLGDWAVIVDRCDRIDGELARRQYKAIRTALLCAKGRALAHLGAHAAADRVLATAVRVCPRGAVDSLILLEASKAVAATLEGSTGQGDAHFQRAVAAARAIGHQYHEAWIARQQTEIAQHAHAHVAVPARSLGLTDTALLLTDVSTILGAGHSVDLLAHRIVSLLESTGLRGRVNVESESGCEFQAEPSATCDVTPDGAFALQLRGSDRGVTIRVHGATGIAEISLLKSVSDVVQIAIHRTADAEHEDENQTLWPRATAPAGDDTIFRSPRMIELVKVAMRLADTQLPILITGETGTGKEIMARLIHDHSRRRRGPFAPFNCSATARDLVESQLFGHRRGSFTGATEAFSGVIRAAEHGTLFLDEIGDLDPGVQPKLLRFLESGEIQPVGEARTLSVSVRLVAATNADLESLVAQGRFREDLFYRLGSARLTLPPLRERKDEIPALVSGFVSRFSRECQRSALRVSDEFIAALLLHEWPGNIRELSNEVRRAVAMAQNGGTLTVADLSPRVAARWNDRPAADRDDAPSVRVRLDQTLSAAMAELEQHFISHALHASGGRVTDAAHLLGLSRKGLFLKRRRRGLVPAAIR
jgi:DNA-binding NtrC family response regulator